MSGILHDDSDLVAALLEALTSATQLHCLARRDGVRFRDEHEDARELDAALQVRMPDGQVLELAIETRRTAYPRDVRLAVEQLRAYEGSRTEAAPQVPVLSVVAADHLSQGSREALRKAGINYFDTSGTLHFHHGTWLVDIERAPQALPGRRIGSVFSGAREQVVHAMLMHWHRTAGRDFISGAELAQMAGTSAYTVSKTMQEMERQDWVQSTGAGPTQRRRISRPAELLDAWAAVWAARSEVRSRWYGFAPEGITSALAKGLVERNGWVLTGAAAANLLVPTLTSVDRAVVVVPPGKGKDWAEGLKLKPADKGANVVFVEREGAALLFAEELPDHPGLRAASPFVQYLDLLDGVGRNKELAAEFRQRYLKLEEAVDV